MIIRLYFKLHNNYVSVYLSPLPEIQWYAPGYSDEAIYTNAKYEFTDPNVKRNLRIKNLTLKDEGDYTCLAFNTFGRSQAKVYLNVTCKY